MQHAFQGRYKDEASAYQAYNQTVKGRRTGAKLGKVNEQAQPPVQSPELREKFKTGQLKRRPRPSGTLRGIWKINVMFTYIDSEGKEYEETRSFIAESSEYTTLLDIPYIEEIILASVDDYVVYWMENDSLRGNYTNKSVEVIPIYRTDKQIEKGEVVDIDTIDELVIE